MTQRVGGGSLKGDRSDRRLIGVDHLFFVAKHLEMTIGGEPEIRVATAFAVCEFAALGLMALLAIRR